VNRRAIADLLADKTLTFQAGDRHFVPVGNGQFHCHPGIEIALHWSGAGAVKLEDGRRTLFRAKSIEVYPPNFEHCQDMIEGGDDLFVHGGFASPPPTDVDLYLFLPRVNDVLVCDELHNMARLPSNLSTLKRAECNHRITALLLRLLAMSESPGACEEASRPEFYARHARLFIRENVLAIDAIEKIAAHVGLSHDYLRHVFQKTFGHSLVHEMNVARVERAKELLRDSALPMKAIAASCGFQTERYFCRVFKKFERTSPIAFRQQAKKWNQ
jgi:AraC-like DNA-binding protein